MKTCALSDKLLGQTFFNKNQAYCKKCQSKKYREWSKNNRDKINKNRKELFDKKPWYRIYCNIKSRILNKHRNKNKSYLRNNIKNFLSPEDIKFLWERDNGSSMKKPSIDRIDSLKDYTIDNCRIMELSENIKRKRSYCYVFSNSNG